MTHPLGNITCFVIVPTGYVRHGLRRYVSRSKCEASGLGYCNAETVIVDRQDVNVTSEAGAFNDLRERARLAYPMHMTDEKWPRACACGNVFGIGDMAMITRERLWKPDGQAEGGFVFPRDEAPVGAMYNATWLLDTYPGPDGKCLVVKCPDGLAGHGGEWIVDETNIPTGCERWTRHGTWPKVTATPSILFRDSGFHAFLVEGVLVRCEDSRC